MRPFQVIVTKSAQKELERLPAAATSRIREAIDGLSQNPKPPGVKKLKGEVNTYRIRLGDYRVVYEVHNKEVLVLVIRIRHRKDAYQ